jgi:hypothetical protein
MVLNTRVHEHKECLLLQQVTIRRLILKLRIYYIKPIGQGCDGHVDSTENTYREVDFFFHMIRKIVCIVAT